MKLLLLFLLYLVTIIAASVTKQQDSGVSQNENLLPFTWYQKTLNH